MSTGLTLVAGMSIVNDLYHQAMELARSDRAELARLLLLSLEPEQRDPDWDEAWRREIERRLKSMDRGEAKLLDAQEMIANLRKSLKRKSTP